MDLSYRSNGYDVLSYAECLNLVDKIDIDTINKLYKGNKSYMNFKFIGKGGQGKVYLISSKTCGCIVMKVMKLSSDIELLINKQCREIINKSICPNFLYYYGARRIKYYGLTFSEYADGTLEDWLHSAHSYTEWRSFMFQFLVGVLVIQRILKTFHSDLKPKNIFFKKLDRNIAFEYNISGSKYIVPTLGNLYILSDFGRAKSLIFKNSSNLNSVELFIKNNADLEHIIDLHKRIIVNSAERIYSLDDLIKIIKLKNDEYFEAYYQDTKESINKDLAKYPQHVRNKMIHRSVVYYVVEKDYIDPYSIPRDKIVMELPPREIIAQISEWKKYKNIEDILQTFNEFKNATEDLKIIKFTLKN